MLTWLDRYTKYFVAFRDHPVGESDSFSDDRRWIDDLSVAAVAFELYCPYYCITMYYYLKNVFYNLH